MSEQHLTKQNKRERPSLRTYGYLAGVLILGISTGLLLYPNLPYPAIWQFVLLGVSLIIMALTAPALTNRQ